MVLQSKVYITNPQVNSGNELNMLANNINTSWAILVRPFNKPRRAITTNYTESLSPATNQGFANPVHTITGVIDLKQVHNTTTIDYEHIVDLINNADQIVTIKSDKFITTTNTTGEVNCMIQNYSDTLSNTNVLNYTMVLVEVYS